MVSPREAIDKSKGLKLKSLKVVIIEDTRSMQLLLVRMLEKWGYTVISSETAEKALELIYSEPPNIVITDWMLPGMDGPTLCTKIRNIKTPHYIYLMVVTALNDVKNVVTALEAGADDFLQKPINYSELKVRLMTGNRIIEQEEKLIKQNAYLSTISNKLNDINGKLLATQLKIQQEMEFAEKIQRNLLPKNNILLNNLNFHHLYYPSMFISGDILNYFKVNQEIVCFYAVDVCGHGIASAMTSYTISQIISHSLNFNAYALNLDKNSDIFEKPHIFVDYLNNIFYKKENDYSLYFSMIFGFANTQSKTLSFCQAGLPHPIFQRLDSSLEFLGNGGFPVALLPTPCYDSTTLRFQSGERLYLYSDGVTDCSDGYDNIFDTKNLLAFLKQSQSLTLEQVFSGLKDKLVDWHGSEKFDDDISVLGIDFV